MKQLLQVKKQEVTKLANILLAKETVELDELTAIFGKRDGTEKGKFDDYIQDLQEKKKSTAGHVPEVAIKI